MNGIMIKPDWIIYSYAITGWLNFNRFLSNTSKLSGFFILLRPIEEKKKKNTN